MATTEHTINDALAEVLSETRSSWSTKGIVRSENTEVLKASGERPDILVTEPSVSAVVIETEVMPATSVEMDAVQCLGEQLLPSGHLVLSSLAVRMPMKQRDHSGPSLKHELASASDFDMALYTGENPEKHLRWPRTGWLRGNTIDLSFLIQLASVPPAVIEHAADRLVTAEDGPLALFRRKLAPRANK